SSDVCSSDLRSPNVKGLPKNRPSRAWTSRSHCGARIPRTTSPTWPPSWLRLRPIISLASRSTSMAACCGIDEEGTGKRGNGDDEEESEKRRRGETEKSKNRFPFPDSPIPRFLLHRFPDSPILRFPDSCFPGSPFPALLR